MNRKSRMVVHVVATAIVTVSAQAVKAQWVQTSGPGAGQILALCATGSTIFAGTHGSGVFLSANNGANWAEVNSGLTNKEIWSLVESGGNIFAGTDGSGIFRSANNGTSWTVVDAGPSNTDVQSLAVSGNNIFAGTDGSGIFRSNNNGTTWTSLYSGPMYIRANCLAVSGSNIFAGTGYGGVFLSTNNGTSWTLVDSSQPPGTALLSVSSVAASGSTIFAVNNLEVRLAHYETWVYRSIDNGTSWMRADSGLAHRAINQLYVSGKNIFAGTDSGVFISTLNGTSWTAAGLKNLEIQSLAASGTYLFAGTSDSTVWRRPLSEIIGTIEKPARHQTDHDAFKLFFPGSGSKASIQFSLASRERVSIAVYNLSGHAIRSLADKQFEPGTHALSMDTRSIAPGCYTVKMQAGANICVKNFTVMR